MIAFKRRQFFIFLLATGVAAGIPSGAKAQTCVSNVPHVTGQWMTLPYQMPINPISASLLRTGEVLIVAGSENDAHNNSEGSESYRAAVWDPTGSTQSSIAVQQLTYDVFCSGTAVLPDGRPFVVGGTSDYSFTGDNRASFFDPATGRFAQSQSMVDGRWYATATTLGDGRIMAFSGLKLSGGTNNTVEIYGIGAGWSSPSSPAPFVPPLYPRMALLPNGKVFYTGHGSGGSNTSGWMFDPSAETWTSSVPTTRNRTYGSAVILPLLPPAYTTKVMALGGGKPATSSTEFIDLSAAAPAWTPGPSMSTGRIQMDAVVLPDGTVLAMGGSVDNEVPNGPGKTADLYDPVTNAFRSAGFASYSRLYHSTALLLPDARVMSIGSNPGSRGRYEAAIEIYTPAYLFDSSDLLITTSRPSITAITPTSGVVGYDAPFSVNFSSASPIASAVLVRPGSVTHAFDMEQRLIGLCGPSPQPPCSAGGGTLSLTSPPNGNIAPPGYYMLFLLDSAGVPSKAQFIQLSAHSTSPPSGAIASPVSDVTIPAGGSVVFSTNTSAAKYSWIFPGGSPTTSVAQAPGSVLFDVPGTYVTSLTVIDAGGNSDPSPPTRTITVTPPTPDFSITSSPPAQMVTPGQATTFTVTVTPITGFAGPVTLTVDSESPFPSGVTSGGFSPASINGSGSSTLTMNTTTSTVPFALSLTVTGTSGALTHTTSTTLLVNLARPASLTATPGDAQVSLSWAASIGANGYHVKRSRTSGGPYVGIACPTGTSYVDTGLTNGTTYYYVVSASFTGGPVAGGESADSSQASATPQPLPPPSVAITSPVNGATFTAPASITINATASDTDGTVTKVDFYRNGSFLGTDTTSPYSFTWSNVVAGTYSLTAVATDNSNATGTSPPVSIIVSPPGGGLPPPWVDQDIGSPALVGGASYATGVFTVKGSGIDIWDSSDQFHYVYQPLSGDVTITARVATIQSTNNYAKGGVMIRETLASGSKHAMMVLMVLAPGHRLEFQRRITTGGLSSHTAGALVTAPYWVKLVRSGNTFSGYASSNGVSWTLVGSATISMTAAVYVGMPLTSHNASAVRTATFDNVSVTGPANNPPSVSITSPSNGATFTAPASITINATASDTDGTVTKVDFYRNGSFLGTDTTSPYSFTWSNVGAGTYSLTAVATDNSNATGTSPPVSIIVSPTGGGLPPPWVDQDIGSPALVGSASYATGVFTVKGSGIDIWDNSDHFHYVYQPLSGDVTIIARVASIQNTNAWAKGGVMIRETLATGSKHAMMALTPGHGLDFQRRITTDGSSSHTAGALVAAPYWVKLVRSGNTFSGYASSNGVSWTLVGSVTISMTAAVYLGMPLTSHNASAVCTATFDSVSVTGSANNPPSVKITSLSTGRRAPPGTYRAKLLLNPLE